MDTPRTRVSDTIGFTSITDTWKRISNGEVLASNTQQVSWEGGVKSITDVKHSLYNERIRKGELIMGPLDLSVEERNVGSAELTFQNGGYNRQISGDFWSIVPSVMDTNPFATPNWGAVQQCEDVAVTKAHAKLNVATMDGIENTSEIIGALTMMARPLTGVRTLARNIYISAKNRYGTNLSRRAGLAWADCLAQARLEYAYGWSPLMSDVAVWSNIAMKGLDKLSSGRHTVRARYRLNTVKVHETNGRPFGGGLASVVPVATVETSDVVTADAGVIYGLSSMATNEHWAKTLGLRVDDVHRSLFNVTPYSLVLDWFANVGDWISATHPHPNIVILGSWVTTKRERLSMGRGSLVGTNDDGTESYGGLGHLMDSHAVIQRKINPTVPSSPTIYPEWGTMDQAVNGLSMAWQLASNALKKIT